MIMDERCEFADASVLATAQGTTNVGDQIPLSVARNVGSPPRPLYLVIQVVAAVTGAGASVAFALVSDTSSPPLLDGTQTVHWQGKATVVAGLPAGQVVAVIPLPGEPPAYESILGVQATVSGAALTAGSVNAFLTHDPKQWKAYPDAL